MPNADDFREALTEELLEAQNRGLSYIDVKSGDLHRRLGGYPGRHHCMPTVCFVMESMMISGDKILYAPPKGRGATLEIRYALPRPYLHRKERRPLTATSLEPPIFKEKSKSTEFEELASEILSKYLGAPLAKGRVPGVPKIFDLTSSDGRIVGDAKYMTLVKGSRLPPAKFSVIAEYVLQLGKTSAIHKFLVFGNDRRVPEEWLKRYSSLATDVTFYFLDETTHKLEKLN